MARIVFFRGSESSSHIFDAGQNSLSVLQSRDYSPDLVQHGCAFYVPTIIDVDSALSYDGVDLAIRIYLDCIQSGIFDIAIFLLSAENKGSFYSHCDRADILKCPNVFFIRNSKTTIEASICTLDIPAFEKETALSSLKTLKLKAPSAYKSHHSITNEWSIYRWSQFLGIDNVSITSEVENSLYFKHLAAINSLNSVGSTEMLPSIPTDPKASKPKILLIDDEAEKGWHDFFVRMLSKSSVIFESLGGPAFRHKTSDEIEEMAISKVISFDPDVVVLDLRLEDADFDSEKTAKEYTGIRILKRIKQDINQGIQVIGFTASNKVWNYLEWSDSGHGIDDIVVKESPELSSNPSYTADSIIHLASSLRTMIGRAQYLKGIDKKLKLIGALIQSLDSSLYVEEKHNISVAYELIKQYDLDPKYIAYAYLQLFQILEKYLKSISDWDGDFFKLKYSEKEYRLINRTTSECALTDPNGKGNYALGKGVYNVTKGFIETNFIMCAALVFLYGKKNTPGDWMSVRSVRNKKAVHPEKYGNVTQKEFLNLLTYLQYVFDLKNLSLRNESEALVELPPPTPSGATLSDDPAIASLLLSMKK